jgi:hypothetical protein
MTEEPELRQTYSLQQTLPRDSQFFSRVDVAQGHRYENLRRSHEKNANIMFFRQNPLVKLMNELRAVKLLCLKDTEDNSSRPARRG